MGDYGVWASWRKAKAYDLITIVQIYVAAPCGLENLSGGVVGETFDYVWPIKLSSTRRPASS
jgi:hypothetical protein